MSDIDSLSSEEQDILLWVAESEIGTIEPSNVMVADRPAFAWMNMVVDQLVRRGLLGRDEIQANKGGANLNGLCAYLTAQGARAVIELWGRRLGTTQPH